MTADQLTAIMAAIIYAGSSNEHSPGAAVGAAKSILEEINRQIDKQRWPNPLDAS